MMASFMFSQTAYCNECSQQSNVQTSAILCFLTANKFHAVFDVRVFDTYVPSYCSTTLVQCYRRDEQDKEACTRTRRE